MKLSPQLRARLWVVWGLGVAGLVGGFGWLLLAPRAQIRMDADGGYFVDPSPRQYVQADFLFAGISLVLGVAVGLLVWRRLKEFPRAAVVGLAVGGSAASLLMWAIGHQFGKIDRAAALKAPVGTIVQDSLDLTAHGLLVMLPVVAVATWLLVDLLDGRRNPVPAATPFELAGPYAPAAPFAPAAPSAPAGDGPVEADQQG